MVPSKHWHESFVRISYFVKQSHKKVLLYMYYSDSANNVLLSVSELAVEDDLAVKELLSTLWHMNVADLI